MARVAVLAGVPSPGDGWEMSGNFHDVELPVRKTTALDHDTSEVLMNNAGESPGTAIQRRFHWTGTVMMMLAVAGMGCQSRSPAESGAVDVPVAPVRAEPHADPAELASSLPPTDAPAPPNPAGYVGPEACSTCHARHFNDYRLTNHFRACRAPIPAEMPPGFEGDLGTFPSPYPGLKFEMRKMGDQFFQVAEQTTGGQSRRSLARIDLVYGAGGTADDVFLSWRDDGSLWELPVAWLYPTRSWGASHFDPNGSGDFSRALTVRCFECHNTWVEHVPGTANHYRREGALLGISCESCHGPGRDHVAYHQAHPEAEVGMAIVQPRKLSRELELDICLQCHSNAINRRGPGFHYRAGQPLAQSYRTLSTVHNEDDHVANQIKYLRESACFRSSERMTCATCHDPHRPKGPENAGNHSCSQCHQPEACTDRPQLPAEVRDDCVSCHMRPYLKINVNFQTAEDNFLVPFRRIDHHIRVNPVARREVLLQWHAQRDGDEHRQQVQQLGRELVQHWREQADAATKEYRFLAAVAAWREAHRWDQGAEVSESLRRAIRVQADLDSAWATAFRQIGGKQTDEAIQTLTGILAVKPTDAKAHGKLGTQYANQGKRELAVQHLRDVAKYDPDDAYGLAMLGWLALLDGQLTDAVRFFEEADAIEPYEAKVNYHLGLALAQSNRLPEATQRFRKAVEIEPQHVDARDSLVLALQQQGAVDEALALARENVAFTQRRHLDSLLTLMGLLGSRQEWPEAIQVGQHALTLAESAYPQRVPQVRQAIEQLRQRIRSSE